MISSVRQSIIPALAAGFLASASSLAALEANPSDVTSEDLLLAENPLVIKSRIQFGNEFSEAGGGGYRDKLVLGGVYGFGFDGQNKDYGIGFELPWLFNDPEAGGSANGIGDLKLRAGHLWTDDPAGWRSGWFSEVEFDTSAEDVYAIANQRTQAAFGLGAAHPIIGKLVLTGTVQYGWSFEDGTTTGRKSEWETHLTASYKLIEHVSVSLDYKAVINIVDDAKLSNTLEPRLGWTIGQNRDIGLYASWELPIDETNTNWTAKAGLIWFF